MKKITTVLFDLDGTLINTNPLILKTFELTLKQYLPSEVYTIERMMDFIGPTLKQSFDELLPEKSEEMVEYYRNLNKQLHDDMVEIYPSVLEGLELLKEHKITLGIVSSKKRDMVMHGLKHFSIDHYFSVVIGADDVINHKPHKEPVLKALLLLKCEPHEALFVGDNSHDIEGGINAGVKTCAVAWALRGAEYLKQFKPDYILEDMRDLLNIIDEVN